MAHEHMNAGTQNTLKATIYRSMKNCCPSGSNISKTGMEFIESAAVFKQLRNKRIYTEEIMNVNNALRYL